MVGLVDIYQRLRGTCFLNVQGRRLSLLFPEDGGGTFLRSASSTFPLKCMLSHSRTNEPCKLPLCEPTILGGFFFVLSRGTVFKTVEMVFRHLRKTEKRDY